MKKRIILVTVLALNISLTFAQKTLKMYNQVFKASEILGPKNPDWGPNAAELKTEFMNEPNVVSNLYELLGSYYTTTNFYDTKKLLNLTLDADLPILDSIDFRFYKEYSLTNVLDKRSDFKNDANYAKFKKEFKAAKTTSEKRGILYDKEENEVYRIALEETKFGVYRKKIQITQITQISREFKIGLTAKIKEELKDKANFDAKIENAIKDSVEIYGELNEGYYHEIRLKDEYLKYAKLILKGYISNKALLENKSDIFTEELKDYFNNPNASIITGAAVFEATFNLTKFKRLIVSIGAAIDANIDIKDKSKAPQIKADIEASFIRKKDRTLTVEAAQSFYYLRYCYAKGLDLGAGAK